jgi:hypothetical protein
MSHDPKEMHNFNCLSYQYWLPENINSQPERKTNTQVTLILFDWKTSESFIYRTYED